MKFISVLLVFLSILAHYVTSTQSDSQSASQNLADPSQYSGWLVNSSYSNNDCTGTINQLLLRSFDECLQIGSQVGVRQYCVSSTNGANGITWSSFETLYEDSKCLTAIPSKVGIPVVSGTSCDSNGNKVTCQPTLTQLPFTSSPRAFIESVYVGGMCDESRLYQRIITPQGGCTVIEVMQTDVQSSGTQIPIQPKAVFFKMASCDYVNNGYIAFGTVHDNNKCSGTGVALSHVLPRGCDSPSTNAPFSATFTCG